MAMMAPCISVSLRPSDGSPKKMKNSCTRNGVLRINSTYADTGGRSHFGPKERAHAHTIPTPTPITAPMAINSMVMAIPFTRTGVYSRIEPKSK